MKTYKDEFFPSSDVVELVIKKVICPLLREYESSRM